MTALFAQAPAAAPTNYWGLLHVPGIARLTAGNLVGRLGNQVWQIVIVLFVLQKFHSPVLAGLTLFLGVFPGLLLSPAAGALLDRYGRSLLISLDYAVSTLSLMAMVALSASGNLRPATLLTLVSLASITSLLSAAGQRSLMPLLLTRDCWDRGNALDGVCYTLTAIVGPPLGGMVVGLAGGEAGLLAAATMYLLAGCAFVGRSGPPSAHVAGGSIWRNAAGGVRYVLTSPTLRGVAVACFVLRTAGGLIVVGLPVLILGRLHGTPSQLGLLWGAQGLAGALAGLLFGRVSSEGRERRTMAAAAGLAGAALALLSFANSAVMVFAAVVLYGLVMGPYDVAMFSLRQRRTDPAWFGRAFAISMSLNFAGMPIGSAIAGPISLQSTAGTLPLPPPRP